MDHEPEPSFDPRSWVAPRPAPVTAVPRARAISPPRPALRKVFGAPLFAHATGLAVALAGAVLAWAARPDAPAPVTPVAPPASPVPGLERRTLLVPGIADLGSSLLALGTAPGDAAQAARLAGEKLGVAPGELRLEASLAARSAGGRLHELLVTQADGSGVAVTRPNGALAAVAITTTLKKQMGFVRGELDGESFYTSAVAAGVADVLVGEFANAFRYDFDMQREVAPGDVFEAGFEQRSAPDGTAVGAPVLVYVSLATAAKSRALYRYQPSGGGAAEWFDSAGRSSRRALMRTPVEAARISSGFGLRGHPILGFVKMHRGTDFAAPTGTPIYAAGDAVVAFAAPKGANGNFVRLRHDNGWETLYLHLNRFAPGITPGVRVAQGQPLGEVGTTGRSTGPHLHYEVHVAGQAVDPLSVDTGGGQTLSGAALGRFRRVRDGVDRSRAATAMRLNSRSLRKVRCILAVPGGSCAGIATPARHASLDPAQGSASPASTPHKPFTSTNPA